MNLIPLVRPLVAVAVTLPLVGCAVDEPDLEMAIAPTIIGQNDLTPVDATGSNIPARYRGVIDAVGHMYPSGCTATHIGNGIAISAGHCFDAPNLRVNDRPCSETIVWRERPGVVNPPRSTCTRILAMQELQPYDYAIFEVSSPPVDAIPPRLNAGSSYAVGYTGTLFSHPAWRMLEWSKTCSVTPPYATGFNHTCDTEGGSSGAAMLEDSNLMVTGIHYASGGTNFGVFLSATPLAEYFNARAWRYLDARGDFPFTINRADGTLHTFFRTRDGEIRYQNESGGQNNLGGWFRGSPVVGRHPDGRLHAFALGSDNALYHRVEQSVGGSWTGWASLGAWVRDVAIGKNQDGRLELYAVGSDGALYQQWETSVGGGYSGWYRFSAVMGGAPFAVQHQDGRQVVFARGTDGALWFKPQIYFNGGWGAWTRVGGAIQGRPTAMLDAWGYIVVFVHGADGRIYSSTQTSPNASSFGAPVARTSSAGGPPVVGTQSDRGWDVYYRGSDGRMMHMTQGGGTWLSLGSWSPNGQHAVGRRRNGRMVVTAPDPAGNLWTADKY